MTNADELKLLKETFEDFIKSSQDLKNSYNILKNESTLLSIYLSNILENLDHAILVFDNDYSLKISNQRAEYYFPNLKEKEFPVVFDDLRIKCLFDLKIILEEADFSKEIIIQNNTNQEWLEIIKSPFLDNNNMQIGFLLMISDKTEFNQMQQKLRKEDRLRVMGELAAEVAHEIRNPLGSIELMTSLLQENITDNSQNSELIERIRSSVDNMNHIVSNILLYTRELFIKPSVFFVEKLINDSIDMIWDIIVKKQIVIKKQLEMLEFKGDFEMLKQALANIIKNSCQALEQQGKIEIEVSKKEKFLIICIRDFGKGITEEVISKIFKPFFTTKNTGTGLGLAMVKRVVEAHDGHINFKSDTNKTECLIKLLMN